MAFKTSARLSVTPLFSSAKSFPKNPILKTFSNKSWILLPSPLLFTRFFHHQTIYLLHTQHSGPHGVLLDALQKQHRLPSKPHFEGDLPEDINIPEEIRRLKSSLKWLFQVWPSTISSRSQTPSIKHLPPSQLQNASSPSPPNKNSKVARTASEQQLYDVLDYLKSKNIAIRRLPKLPWLLTAHPAAIEASTAHAQRMLSISSFKVAISFCNLPPQKLIEVATLWHRDRFPRGTFKNRVDWLAHELYCAPEDISDMMARYSQVVTLPVPQIFDVLCTLDKIVKPEAIVNDPWVFTGNLKTTKSRAKLLRENNLYDLKPWVFRSPQRLFDKFIGKKLEQRSLLGDKKDVAGFLMDKLQLESMDTVQGMLKKTPALKRLSVIKLNEMIEFLHGEGYTSEQISETPRVLAHSVDTISERLSELSKLNRSEIDLHLLCRTSVHYRAAVRRLKKDTRTTIAIE